MANRQETIIIDVQVADVKKQLGDTAKAINDLKEQNKDIKKEQKDGKADWAESTATIKANEAQIKLLTKSINHHAPIVNKSPAFFPSFPFFHDIYASRIRRIRTKETTIKLIPSVVPNTFLILIATVALSLSP